MLSEGKLLLAIVEVRCVLERQKEDLQTMRLSSDARDRCREIPR